MEQLLLVNPRKRRRKSRKLPPRGAGGKFLSRKRRASPARSHRRRRRNPVPSALAAIGNPRRRRSRRRNPVRALRRRSYRRNPIGRGFLSNLTAPLMPAVIGAGGAFVTDAVFARLPLPFSLKAGNLAIVAKAALAVALGMLVSRFASARIGQQMTAGALTVQAHAALAPFAAQIPGLGYYGAGYALPAATVGEYISDIPDSMRDAQFYARDPLAEYIDNN